MSSAIRTSHKNTTGSFFIVTALYYDQSGLLWPTLGGSGTALEQYRPAEAEARIAIGDILIDLGEIKTLDILGQTYFLKKVAKLSNPTQTGYIHLPSNGTNITSPAYAIGPQELIGPRVAKFQL
jgi:hypothetical protein